jgi:glycosyltransferase involved in cell wall biosynthesis
MPKVFALTQNYGGGIPITKRLLIATYGNPRENPGPASFAWKLSEGLKDGYTPYILGTYKSTPQNDCLSNEAYFRIKDSNSSFSALKRSYQRYLHFGFVTFLLKQVYKNRIEIVNFHNLGMVIPLIVFPILRILKLKTIVTFHDYTNVYNHKLYPIDLENIKKSFSRNLLSNFRKRIILVLNRKLISCANRIVYLSVDQKSTYMKFKFPEGVLIENKINHCSCDFQDRADLAKPKVIFIGRRIGKGLDTLIEWIGSQDLFKLTLVGGEDLLELAQNNLPNSKYEYLGHLTSHDVFLAIHASTVLYAVSDCLDVYPTTVLEGIVHGKPVLVSKNCGNHTLVSRINPRFLVEGIQNIAPYELLDLSTNWDFEKKSTAVIHEICDTNQQLDAYTTLFSE